MTSSEQKNDHAEHILYKVYWRLCLNDILFHLGFPPTKENKELLHDFHKRVLGYDTTAGRSHDVLSRFITDVTILWADMGIFVRTNKKQPLYIERMGLRDLVKAGDEYKQVWDLL